MTWTLLKTNQTSSRVSNTCQNKMYFYIMGLGIWWCMFRRMRQHELIVGNGIAHDTTFFALNKWGAIILHLKRVKIFGTLWTTSKSSILYLNLLNKLFQCKEKKDRTKFKEMMYGYEAIGSKEVLNDLTPTLVPFLNILRNDFACWFYQRTPLILMT